MRGQREQGMFFSHTVLFLLPAPFSPRESRELTPDGMGLAVAAWLCAHHPWADGPRPQHTQARLPGFAPASLFLVASSLPLEVLPIFFLIKKVLICLLHWMKYTNSVCVCKAVHSRRAFSHSRTTWLWGHTALLPLLFSFTVNLGESVTSAPPESPH